MRRHRRLDKDKQPIDVRDSDIMGKNFTYTRSVSAPYGRNESTDRILASAHPDLNFPINSHLKKIGVELKPMGATNYVLVWDSELRKELETHGILPQNIGTGHRKDREFHLTEDAAAISLYDLLFAFQLGIVDSNSNNRHMTYNALLITGTMKDPDFIEKFSVYLDLRRKGLLVMDGQNYGVDFVVYSDNPEEFKSKQREHSRALVDVTNSRNMRLTEAIKGEQLAKSINKDYIMAIASGNRDDDYHLLDMTSDVTYRVLNTSELGIDSTVDVTAQIAKRLGDKKVIPWELRKRY